MPTTRLPDINTGFARHRAQVGAALDAGDYEKAIMSVKAFNSLLPDDADESGRPKYRVVFDTALHAQATAQKITGECPACHETLPRAEIRPYELQLTRFEQTLTGRRTAKF